MIALYIILGVAAALAVICLSISLVCYFMVFYSPKQKKLAPDEYDIPKGEIYQEFRDAMIEWQKSIRSIPHEKIKISSHDGLILHGKYYECDPDGPVEILFHGYKGNAERDMSGAVERCFALGRNALIVSQRGHGGSSGHTITFGIKEKRDCISWINYASERFGENKEIIITGISMGAATVLMAAGEDLPKNVVCVLADCGYSSPREIISKVMREMRLPVALVYPFVKLGARVFGGFDLEEDSPIEAMKRCKIPVIFIHGDNDDFVPVEMSREMYEVCSSPKKLVEIKGAGHGLAFPVDKEGYLNALREFERVWRAHK